MSGGLCLACGMICTDPEHAAPCGDVHIDTEGKRAWICGLDADHFGDHRDRRDLDRRHWPR